jgi:ATP-dependent DNA ligase
MNPMLASDAVETKLVFPVGVQPKIDGVRSHNPKGVLLARSCKKHRNKYTTAFYSTQEHTGLDGEMAAQLETHPALCRLTSSALSTSEGSPFTLWWCFDFVGPQTAGLPYEERYMFLQTYVSSMHSLGKCGHVRVVPMYIANNLEELLGFEAQWLEEGYEGIIIRNLSGQHKNGRSTVREGGLLRIKRFIEEEARVVGITEGEHNENEAQSNELGRTFRSSHQENKVPNGRVGSLQCVILKDSKLFKEGQEINVSKGEMTDEESKEFFENKETIVGHVIKFKHFPKGVKNKPRFPTYVCIRAAEDM